MSIFKHATERETGSVFMDRIRLCNYTMATSPTGNVNHYTIDRNTEYVVKLEIAQNFWANTAQYHDGKKIAIECIAQYLYEDVLREIPHLLNCIQSGDKQGAIEAALRIKQATQP